MCCGWKDVMKRENEGGLVRYMNDRIRTEYKYERHETGVSE